MSSELNYQFATKRYSLTSTELKCVDSACSANNFIVKLENVNPEYIHDTFILQINFSPILLLISNLDDIFRDIYQIMKTPRMPMKENNAKTFICLFLILAFFSILFPAMSLVFITTFIFALSFYPYRKRYSSFKFYRMNSNEIAFSISHGIGDGTEAKIFSDQIASRIRETADH